MCTKTYAFQHLYEAYLVLITVNTHVPANSVGYRIIPKHIDSHVHRIKNASPFIPHPRFGIPVVFVLTLNKTFHSSNVEIVANTFFSCLSVLSHRTLFSFNSISNTYRKSYPVRAKFFFSVCRYIPHGTRFSFDIQHYLIVHALVAGFCVCRLPVRSCG